MEIAMPIYLMLGTLTQAARKAVSAKSTEDAMAFTKKHGGEFKVCSARLSEGALLATLGLPDAERAIQVSVGPSRLLDISFGTHPRSASTSPTGSRQSRPWAG
jgi:hypothetical protein